MSMVTLNGNTYKRFKNMRTNTWVVTFLIVFFLCSAISPILRAQEELSAIVKKTAPSTGKEKTFAEWKMSSTAEQQTPDKGKEIFNKMVDAIGGRAAIMAVKNKVYSADVTLATAQGEQELAIVATIEYPDKVHMKISIQGETMERVVSGLQGKVTISGASEAMQSPEVQEMRSNFLRDVVWLVQNADSLQMQFIEEVIIATVKVAKISLTAQDGRMVVIAVDTKTNLPNRFIYQVRSQEPPVLEENILGDFRSVGDILFPYRQFITNGGKVIQESRIKEININQTVNPDLFIIK